MLVLTQFEPLYGPEVWGWLQEYPDANLDDYGPRTLEELLSETARRTAAGELVRVALLDGSPVGLIGYCPLTARTGMFHGICFARRVHGQGVARRAVAAFLRELFDAGVEKVSAAFFADNRRIQDFLNGFGACPEGYLRRQTLRHGRAVDMCLVAIFREDFQLCHSADY